MAEVSSVFLLKTVDFVTRANVCVGCARWGGWNSNYRESDFKVASILVNGLKTVFNSAAKGKRNSCFQFPMRRWPLVSSVFVNRWRQFSHVRVTSTTQSVKLRLISVLVERKICFRFWSARNRTILLAALDFWPIKRTEGFVCVHNWMEASKIGELVKCCVSIGRDNKAT